MIDLRPAARPDPYACPLADPAAGEVCPHRRYPTCFANAPQDERLAMHRSVCLRQEGDCLSLLADAHG